MEKKVRVCDECGKEVNFNISSNAPNGWLLLRNIHLDYYDKSGECSGRNNELQFSNLIDFCSSQCFIKWINRASLGICKDN